MSTSSSHSTPHAHGSLSNNTVDPTLALISMMQQSLQKNAMMIAQINSRSSPQPPQTQSMSYQFKPQHPPPFQNGTAHYQLPPCSWHRSRPTRPRPSTTMCMTGRKEHRPNYSSSSSSAWKFWLRFRHRFHR